MISALLFLVAAPVKIALAEPFLATANGQPIKVDVGHAAPIFVDFDGDGLKDLLVGQFGGGKLRIYKNIGTKTQPKFGDFQWFEADGKIAQIEAG